MARGDPELASIRVTSVRERVEILVNTQRNEKYWGDKADEFIPSRFDNRNPGSESNNSRTVTYMDGKIKLPAKGTFIIFGDGPRACLGTSHAV